MVGIFKTKKLKIRTLQRQCTVKQALAQRLRSAINNSVHRRLSGRHALLACITVSPSSLSKTSRTKILSPFSAPFVKPKYTSSTENSLPEARKAAVSEETVSRCPTLDGKDLKLRHMNKACHAVYQAPSDTSVLANSCHLASGNSSFRRPLRYSKVSPATVSSLLS